MQQLTWSSDGRPSTNTPGAGWCPGAKQTEQLAQGLPRDVQGGWSGGGQGSDSRPAGSSGGKARQHWGREGLTQDRKSSSQEAGGPASQLVLGLRAALLTCTHGDSSRPLPGQVPASRKQQYSGITKACTAAPTEFLRLTLLRKESSLQPATLQTALTSGLLLVTLMSSTTKYSGGPTRSLSYRSSK